MSNDKQTYTGTFIVRLDDLAELLVNALPDGLEESAYDAIGEAASIAYDGDEMFMEYTVSKSEDGWDVEIGPA